MIMGFEKVLSAKDELGIRDLQLPYVLVQTFTSVTWIFLWGGKDYDFNDSNISFASIIEHFILAFIIYVHFFISLHYLTSFFVAVFS